MMPMIDDMLFDNLLAVEEGQPGNNEIIAVYNNYISHPNADTFAALVERRKARATWCGTDELNLRKIIDAQIRARKHEKAKEKKW